MIPIKDNYINIKVYNYVSTKLPVVCVYQTFSNKYRKKEIS